MILNAAYADLVFEQVGSKNINIKRFYQKFFGTTGLQYKPLILIIESPNIFH